MDRRLLVLAVVVGAGLMLSSCGPKKLETVRDTKQFVEATPFKTLPEEVAGDVVTGIGSSEKRGNLSLMREAAITSAQADLARKVEARVEAVWKRTMADWSEYGKEGMSEATSVEEMKTMQKAIVATDLRGPWQLQEFQDRESGRYWVRIILASATVEKYLKSRMNNEALMKKFIIESQVKRVQEDLQKDLNEVKQREKDQLNAIAGIVANQ